MHPIYILLFNFDYIILNSETQAIFFSGAPSIPSEFTAANDTSRSILTSWNPEFSGGLIQTFRLEGKEAGKDYWETINDCKYFALLVSNIGRLITVNNEG